MQMFSVSSTIDLCDLQLVPAKSYLAMATHIQHSGGVHIAYTSPFYRWVSVFHADGGRQWV